MELTLNMINVIFSLILGIGLASLFDTVCKDGNCVIVRSKPLEEVENKIHKKNNKCYRYYAKPAKCTDDKLKH